VLPPIPRGLHIDSIRSEGVEEVTSAVGEGIGGVGSSNEGEGAVVVGVLEGEEGVLEGVEAVGNPVVDVAIDVGVSDELVDNFSRTHLITISNTSLNNHIESIINKYHQIWQAIMNFILLLVCSYSYPHKICIPAYPLEKLERYFLWLASAGIAFPLGLH